MAQKEATCNSTNGYGKYYTQRLWWEVTQSEADKQNNCSTITLKAYLFCNNQYSGPFNTFANQSTLTYFIDGQAVRSSGVKYRTRTAFSATAGSITTSSNPYEYVDGNNAAVYYVGKIGHNQDGSKSVTISMTTSLGGNASLTGGTVSATITLPTIPRASTPTLSKSTFHIGETITVYTNRLSSSFTHSIYMKRADGLYYDPIATGITSSWAWQTGDLLFQQIPNKDEYKADLLLRTFNGNTQIGDKTVSFTAKVTDSNPVMGAVTYTATGTDLTGNDQTVIKGQSDVTLTFPQAAAKNYASIKQYVVKMGNRQQTITDVSSPQVSVTFPNADSASFSVEAVDSRDMHSQVVLVTAAQFIEYEPLSISSAQVKRKNGVDTQTNLSYNGKMFRGSFGTVENELIASVYTYSSTYGEPVTGLTDISPTVSDTGSLSFSGPIWGDEQAAGFAMGSSYSVVLRLQDKLSEVTIPLTLNSGTPGMYMKKNRDGTYIIGFGKTPDGAGKSGIDVAGDIYINGRSLLDKMYPVGSIYISTAETNPKDLFGGTWEEYAKGRVIMGVGDNGKTNYTAGQTGGQDVVTNTHNHYLLSSFDGTGFYMSSSGNAPRSRTKTVSRAHISPDTTGSGTTREDSTYNETLTLDVRQPYIACFIWRRTA